MTAALFDVITVHCFTCPHVERGVSPQAARRAAEYPDGTEGSEREAGG